MFDEDEYDETPQIGEVAEFPFEAKIQVSTNAIVAAAADSIAKSLLPKIEKQVIQKATEIVNVKLAEIVDSALNQPMKRTDSYGHELSSGILKELLTQDIERFLSVVVDYDGKPYSGYGDGKRTRAQYYLGRTMEDFYRNHYQKDVEVAATSIKAKVIEQIKDAVSKQVATQLKI